MASRRRDDDDAFAEAMRGVERLTGPDRVAPGPPPRRTTGNVPVSEGGRRPGASSAIAALGPAPTSGDLDVEELGETWTARANGVDKRAIAKLRDGKVPVEAEIDLHGRTREEAERALEAFVAGAVAAGRRAVLVVHGRGLHSADDVPTLRRAVREALARGPLSGWVLAATSARPALGGPGATVVWLRRGATDPAP